MPKLVIIESPLAGSVRRNVAYAKAAMRDSLMRGEAPFASHLLYAQDDILDDEIDAEREVGIEAGLAWGDQAEATVVYADLGISPGMRTGIERAEAAGRPVEYRRLPNWTWPPKAEVTPANARAAAHRERRQAPTPEKP